MNSQTKDHPLVGKYFLCHGARGGRISGYIVQKFSDNGYLYYVYKERKQTRKQSVFFLSPTPGFMVDFNFVIFDLETEMFEAIDEANKNNETRRQENKMCQNQPQQMVDDSFDVKSSM